MLLNVKRVLASAVNVATAYLLSLPLTFLNWQLALVISFLVYNLACEVLIGRCLGSIATGLRWAGNPSLARRIAFSFTYTAAFTPFVLAPLWLIIPLVFTIQWVWGRVFGGTVQSWIVGMCSEEVK